MLNSLKIATEGYLKRAAKAALIIAVSGYLNYGGGPTPPPPTPPKTYSNNGGASGYGVSHKKEQLYKRIKKEDEDILTIINIFLSCQG